MENQELSYEELSKLVDERKARVAVNKQKYDDESRDRLTKIINTKVKTSFIGAIAEFEKQLGFLWGFKNPEGWTDDQIEIKNAMLLLGFDEVYWKAFWENARTAILNNGNNQIRALQQEIALYSMTWNRHRMTLPVINPMEKKEGNKDE